MVALTVLVALVLGAAAILVITGVTGPSAFAIASGPVFVLVSVRYWIEVRQTRS